MQLEFHSRVADHNHAKHKSRNREANKHKFVGVRQRRSGKWVAEIKNTTQKIRMWLGTFDTAEEAARAYDEAACLLRGSNTRTNFFNSTPCNPAISLKIRNLLNRKRGLNEAISRSQASGQCSNQELKAKTVSPSSYSNKIGCSSDTASDSAYFVDAYEPDLSCFVGGCQIRSHHFNHAMDLDDETTLLKQDTGKMMNELQFPADSQYMKVERQTSSSSSSSFDANEWENMNDPFWDIHNLYQMFCKS